MPPAANQYISATGFMSQTRIRLKTLSLTPSRVVSLLFLDRPRGLCRLKFRAAETSRQRRIVGIASVLAVGNAMKLSVGRWIAWKQKLPGTSSSQNLQGKPPLKFNIDTQNKHFLKGISKPFFLVSILKKLGGVNTSKIKNEFGIIYERAQEPPLA